MPDKDLTAPGTGGVACRADVAAAVCGPSAEPQAGSTRLALRAGVPVHRGVAACGGRSGDAGLRGTLGEYPRHGLEDGNHEGGGFDHLPDAECRTTQQSSSESVGRVVPRVPEQGQGDDHTCIAPPGMHMSLQQPALRRLRGLVEGMVWHVWMSQRQRQRRCHWCMNSFEPRVPATRDLHRRYFGY